MKWVTKLGLVDDGYRTTRTLLRNLDTNCPIQAETFRRSRATPNRNLCYTSIKAEFTLNINMRRSRDFPWLTSCFDFREFSGQTDLYAILNAVADNKVMGGGSLCRM